LGLTATVASTTQGVPTGVVNFVEGGNVVATALLHGGAAAGTYLNPAAGTHVIAAQYLGDVDFVGSTSAGLSVAVGAMPDFVMGTTGTASQTVVGGQAASYALSVSGAP
ncbi:MAG: Ig-like domain-containing protein, partial [Acidobacteriota bacterium]